MSTTPRTRRTPPRVRGGRARTSAAVRAAAARALDEILASEDAFAVLVARLEAAGWRIERSVEAAPSPSPPTPPARRQRSR